jgi:putative ABC transport system permease protein
MMKTYQIAFRNISRNRRRSIFSGLTIGLVSMCIVFMFGYVEGLTGDMADNIHNFVTGHIRLRHDQYDIYEKQQPLHLRIENYKKTLLFLDQNQDVESYSPHISFGTMIYQDNKLYRAMGMGMDFLLEDDFQNFSQYLVKGDMPQPGTNELLLSSGLAEDLGLGINDKIDILTKNMYMGAAGWTFVVKGIVVFPLAALNTKFFFIPLDTCQTFLQMPGSVTEILVKIKNLEKLDSVVADLDKNLPLAGIQNLDAKPWYKVEGFFGFMEMAKWIYLIMGLCFLLLGSTVIVNTIMMIIYERMKEIGTIAAMGMKGKEIVRLFFLEAFFISSIAALIGTALGTGIVLVFQQTGLPIGELLEGIDFQVSDVIYPSLNWFSGISSPLFILFFSIVIASLASLAPSRRAAKIQPVEALRAV